MIKENGDRLSDWLPRCRDELPIIVCLKVGKETLFPNGILTAERSSNQMCGMGHATHRIHISEVYRPSRVPHLQQLQVTHKTPFPSLGEYL
jgi:hypothetical protein